MTVWIRCLAIGATLLLVGCANNGAIVSAADCDPSASVAEELATIDEGERVAGTMEEAAWTPAHRRSFLVFLWPKLK